MIAKISTAVSIAGGLNYNLDKVVQGEAYVLCGSSIPFNSEKNLDTHRNTIQEEFGDHLEVLKHGHGRTKKPIVHISLNPSPDDKVSDIDYSNMTEDYLREMGFEGQPFVVFKHEDIDRHHIHILTTNVRSDGSKIDDSYSKRRSVKACEKLEQDYGLIPAKGQDKSVSENASVSYRDFIFNPNNEDTKAQIKRIANFTNDKYHFETGNEYKAFMRLFGLDARFAKSDADDKKNKGLVFYGLDSSGQHVTEPIQAGTIQKGLFKKIERKFQSEKSKRILSDIRTRNSIKAKLDQAKTATSKDDFFQKLSEQNMDIVFRQNDTGRIYGATVVDHDFGVVLNGSKLGKAYSANVFNELFNSFDAANFGGRTNKPQEQNEYHVTVGDAGGGIFFGGSSGGLAHYERVGEKPEESETDKLNRKSKKRKKRRIH